MQGSTQAENMTEEEWYNQETPKDGESYDGNGHVRPVPADVPMCPDN